MTGEGDDKSTLLSRPEGARFVESTRFALTVVSGADDGARLVIDGEPFKIWRVRVVPGTFARGLQVADGRLMLGCRDAAVEILELQPPSRGRIGAGDFLRGYRGALELG